MVSLAENVECFVQYVSYVTWGECLILEDDNFLKKKK